MEQTIQINGEVRRPNCTTECSNDTTGLWSEAVQHGFVLHSECRNHHPVTISLNAVTADEHQALALLAEQLKEEMKAAECAFVFELFTNPASPDYDAALTQKVRRIRPDWFTQH